MAGCSDAVSEIAMSSSQAPESAILSTKVLMYTTRYCPYCIAARDLLDTKAVEYTDVAVDGNLELRAQISRLSGARTVPQIWINSDHVGGYTELAMLERSGKLDLLLG